MKIREAKKEDIGDLVKLDGEANKEIKWWESLKKSEIKKSLKQKKCLYVAENKKEIIGFLRAKIKRYCIELEDIYIKKEFRKKNIARKVIKKFISDWKKSKFKDIQLMSPLRLRRFYEKVGFKPSMLLMKHNLK